MLLVTPDFPSSFVICSGRLLNNSKSLSDIIGETDWTKCGPIRLIIVNSHLFSFWTNLSITYGLTNHCPYSTLKDYFISTQFISRRFGICRSCDPQKLQSGFKWINIKIYAVYCNHGHFSYLTILTLKIRLFILRMSIVLLSWSLRKVFYEIFKHNFGESVSNPTARVRQLESS